MLDHIGLNVSHVAFTAPDRATVDAFVDLEGNNIEAVCHRSE